jgi:glycosyltransferase involved in cell wall biosynthesis
LGDDRGVTAGPLGRPATSSRLQPSTTDEQSTPFSPPLRVAALVPNQPGVAPGQRFRIEAWARHLEGAGWTVQLCPFEDAALHEVLYQQGRLPEKTARLLGCYGRQLQRVRHLPDCDALVVHREAALVGPAVLERLARRSGVPLVFDLDDPTFVPYRSPTSGWFSMLKFPRKTNSLFRMADQVITVNQLIGDHASRFNPSVTVVPNFVDVDHYRPGLRPPEGDGCTIVWSGSHSTAANLETIAPALRRVQADRRVDVRVVCDGPVPLPGVRADLRQFSPDTQVTDLQTGDVGVVPVADSPWNRWKSFFKVVQYMAVGLPVVAQRMGSNAEVIDDGKNGFVVATEDEWCDRLLTLVDDPALRRRMGEAARATAVRTYSADVQMPRVASVLRRAASGAQPWRIDQS